MLFQNNRCRGPVNDRWAPKGVVYMNMDFGIRHTVVFPLMKLNNSAVNPRTDPDVDSKNVFLGRLCAPKSKGPRRIRPPLILEYRVHSNAAISHAHEKWSFVSV